MTQMIERWIRYLVIAGLGLAAAPAVLLAQTVQLTPAEREYLEQLSPIRVCVDPDWYPFEQINAKGKYVGIGADLLQRIMERIEVDYEVVPTASWEESIRHSRDKTCHILSFLNQTPERSKWLLFTKPTFTDVDVLITRPEHLFISDLSKLRGERIVLPIGSPIQERIRKNYPELIIINAQTDAECIEMVGKKQADMTAQSLILASRLQLKGAWSNFKIAGHLTGYQHTFRIGVIASEPGLRELLDKGVVTLSDQDKNIIVNRYTAPPAPFATYSAIPLRAALILAAALLVLAWRHMELKSYNKRLLKLSETDALTQLFNRLKIGQKLEDEVVRSGRYHRELAVLVIDVDHFKDINDCYGHLVGDDLLCLVANVLKETLRYGDKIGRAGGDEFLVLCPETNISQAIWIADRLRDNVRNKSAAEKMRCTISIGVAGFVPEDTSLTILKRADEAMYRAKSGGRDQTCVIEA